MSGAEHMISECDTEGELVMPESEEGHRRTLRWVHPSWTSLRATHVAMLVVGSALVLTVWGVGLGGGSRAPSAAPRGTARNLLADPQLKEIIVEEVYDVWGDESMSKEELRQNTTRITDEFANILDQHLTSSQRSAMQSRQLDSGDWQDLRRVLRSLRDGRLVRLGRRTLELLANTSVSNEEVEQRIRAECDEMRPYFERVRKDIMPARFSEAAAAHPGSNPFATMFSPQAMREMRRPSAAPDRVPRGDAVAHQVGHMRYLAELAKGDDAADRGAAPGGARSLREGTWLVPTGLMGIEKAVGIVATASIYIVEIVVHCGIIIGFQMPTWGWLMLYSPAVGFGISACISGMSIYCDNLLGALAFNILEGAFWFTVAHSLPHGGGAAAPVNQGSSFLGVGAPAPAPNYAPAPPGNAFSIQSYEGETAR